MDRSIVWRRQPLGLRIRRKARRVWSDFKLARKKRAYRRRVGPPDRKTVAFIVGCQRSGTDMTIKALDHSLDVERFDEYDPRAFDDCRIKDKTVRDRLIARSPARCILFKPVCDSHRVDELLREHAGSRAVWVYRDYRDVANSAVARWADTTQRFILDLVSGGGDWGRRQWNRERVTPEMLDTLRGVVSPSLTPHEAAVLFWYLRNRTFFEQKLETNPQVMLVRYEAVVQDPQSHFERLCAWLDIRFDPDIVAEVRTDSIRRRPFPGADPAIERLADEMLERLDAARTVMASPDPQPLHS